MWHKLGIVAVVLAVVVAFVHLQFGTKTWTLVAKDERREALPGVTFVPFKNGQPQRPVLAADDGTFELDVGVEPWKDAWSVVGCKAGWYTPRAVVRVGRRPDIRPMGSTRTDVVMFPKIVPGLPSEYRAFEAVLPDVCAR